jgi:hypothetical protein
MNITTILEFLIIQYNIRKNELTKKVSFIVYENFSKNDKLLCGIPC